MELPELIEQSVRIRRTPPRNINEKDIDDFEADFSYDTYDSFLRSVGKVWVSPDSVVYKNNLVIRETLATNDLSNYYRFRHLAKMFFKRKKVRLDNQEKFLMLTDSWSTGHFHWLSEVLPKLVCIKDRAKDFVLMLPDHPYTRKIGLDSMEMLGVRFKDIVWMKTEEFYSVENLYYLSRISRTGQMHDGVMKKMRELLASSTRDGPERIYISRSRAKYRKVVNDSDLQELVKEKGFETVFAEDHDLSSQLGLFSNCRILLGIHGAGLANCIFMPPEGKVIELRKREFGATNVGYWHLAESVGQQYYYFNGAPDSEKPLVGRGCNLTIPLRLFEREILKDC